MMSTVTTSERIKFLNKAKKAKCRIEILTRLMLMKIQRKRMSQTIMIWCIWISLTKSLRDIKSRCLKTHQPQRCTPLSDQGPLRASSIKQNNRIWKGSSQMSQRQLRQDHLMKALRNGSIKMMIRTMMWEVRAILGRGNDKKLLIKNRWIRGPFIWWPLAWTAQRITWDLTVLKWWNRERLPHSLIDTRFQDSNSISKSVTSREYLQG